MYTNNANYITHRYTQLPEMVLAFQLPGKYIDVLQHKLLKYSNKNVTERFNYRIFQPQKTKWCLKRKNHKQF